MESVPGSPAGWRGGIRLHLVGLVLLVALPFAVLNMLRLAEKRTESRDHTQLETRRITRLVAARVDERIRTADALLIGLSAQMTVDRDGRLHSDSVLTQTLLTSAGRYANLFLTDSVGTLTASATDPIASADTVVSLSDRRYFRHARTASGYVVGEPVQSRIRSNNSWVVVLARPLRGATGEFVGIIGVSMLLDSLADVVSTTDLPGRPLVTLLDTSGIIIARSEDAAKYQGVRRVAVGDIPDTVSMARVRGLDGAARITGSMRSASAPWLVNVGMLESSAAAAERQRLVNDLLAFCFCAAIAVFVSYRMSQRIVRPLVRLKDDATALTRGITGHRTSADGPTEIRELGEAFNGMADTVERRNTALADSERRYRLLFDSNPLPMWAWDADTGALLAVNEAAIEHYGYDRETFLTLQIGDLLDTLELARFHAARLPFMESRQAAGVWTHRKADGSAVEMEVVTTSSRRLGRASWLSVGIDVTARRAAERALAASEEQLRQSQKMEAIGAFAGGIAHDFNNLLTGMLGYCDLALAGMESTDPAHADIEEIRALALRAADLTRQILVVSRKQVVQPAFVDPNDAVRGLNRLLGRVVGEHITLRTQLADDTGSVFADAGQLEQVLLNLAANARDAMPNGGTITIRTRLLASVDAAALGVKPSMRWVAISVSDTGTGMSESVRSRIFEPFFTTKERGKGTGLGLALAYGMMEQAGGTIRVDTAPDLGSTFHLLLPYHDRPVARTPDEPTDGMGLRGAETVLIAEDEDSVRAVATATLAARGYTVIAANDGESALALSRDYSQRIDLLLTDIVMPGINGRELAETLVRERADLRVLYTSGYTDDESLMQGVRTDELSFLQKPFTPADLTRRVRSLLDAGVRAG
ncbi:MAG TPA: ATP-binding protein [Gemmatimonas sp.]|nr:ATP-binding protein [Gemmatimonas sp.]